MNRNDRLIEFMTKDAESFYGHKPNALEFGVFANSEEGKSSIAEFKKLERSVEFIGDVADELDKVKDKPVNIVSTSGGRTSMYLALLIKQRDPDAIFVFMDTGAEHPKTYEFLRKCNDQYDLNIICIKAHISPVMNEGVSYMVVPIELLNHDNSVMTDYMAKNGTPVSVGATCSDRMKTLAYRAWLKNYMSEGGVNVEDVTTWLGMRVDEPRRLKYPKGIKYLADISDFTKEDVLEFWARQSFDLEIPEHLGNCVFCVKKSPIKIALAARHEPAMAKKWEELIYSPVVRNMPNRKDAGDIMYRDYQSFRSIIDSYADFSTEDLERRVGLYRDNSECSSSCEGDFSTEFVTKEVQLDLLKKYSID